METELSGWAASRRTASDEQVVSAFDVLPLSAAVIDRDGTIIALNRAWIAFARENGGTPKSTGCGSNYFAVCAAADPDASAGAAREGVLRMLEGKTDSFELEYPCHSPDEHRWFLMQAAPLPGSSGAVISHMNITRRRLAEIALDDRVRALERSNEDLSEFSHIIAHDLKEPLRGIGNYTAQVLEDNPDLNPEARRKLETMARLAHRSTEAMDGLLHYASVGMRDLALSPVSLQEIAEEVLDSFRPQLEATGSRAVIVAPLPVLRCDRLQVREAMANLVSNAIKYNDKREKVVEIAPAPRGFSVSDNGIGIDPRGQQQIFDVFTRLQPREKFGGGSGLGLTIVKRIAERHRGRVLVDSVPGKGSTFTFTLGEENLNAF